MRPDPNKSNRDSQHDHLSTSGDVPAFRYTICALDAFGHKLREVVIDVRTSGAFTVGGNIADEALVQAMILHARDAVAGYHLQQGGLTIPGNEVTLPGVPNVARVTIEGPIEERAYTVALLDSVKASMVDYHARRALPRDQGTIRIA